MKFRVAHMLPVPAPYVPESMARLGVMATVNGKVTLASQRPEKTRILSHGLLNGNNMPRMLYVMLLIQ